MPKNIILIYDGECGFCKKWVLRAKRRDRDDKVVLLSCQSEERKLLYSHIAEAECLKAMYVVLPNGHYFFGAEAVPHILNQLPGLKWTVVFFKIPGVMFAARIVYQFVAQNRHLLSGKSCSLN